MKNAAALFRYMREYCVMLRDYSAFVCLDDKHRVKIGEPGFPVAAAERGRRVLVKKGVYFQVGDHDFTKFGMIPSVSLIVAIPEDIHGSWYDGQVVVTFKDSVFEASSPVRHATELCGLLTSTFDDIPPVLFLYTDGGPDHRLVYVSVQLSLIALFLKLDLDFMCAGHTAPCHSWKNPVERIIAILNLGLQCIGLMRQEMPEEMEKEVKSCKNMGDLRRIAENKSELLTAVSDSIYPVKVLLTDVCHRLELKSKKFNVVNSATTSTSGLFCSQLMTA